MRTVQYIREQFPALNNCRDVLLDNADGSRCYRPVHSIAS